MVSPTFHARSITELVALRAATQPDDPAVHTGAPEFADELQTLTYSDVAAAVDRVAAHWASLDLQPPGEGVPPERVIAVLVSTAVDESLLEIALAKLGLTALLLSVNNSVGAVAHLCKLTNASHLIYGPKYASVAQEAQNLLAREGIELGILPDKRFPLWGPDGVRALTAKNMIPTVQPRLTPAQEATRTAVILHSSGSTGFPKPVYVTHYGLIANAAVSVPKTGFSALPLFHGFGHFSIFRCLYHGKAFTLMPPHLPITAANIVRVINASPTRPVQHFAVPYVLKLLEESKEGTRSLAAMEAVSFAGAAVPDDLGTRLVDAGVPLYSQYGTTETGALLTSRRDYATDKAWNWLRIEGLIKQYIELVPRGSSGDGSDMVEVVVKDGWPGKVMSNTPDNSYATKDLFVVHPEHSNWVKYVGRLDDTLTQTLGEKTNPVPIELAIRGNSPLIEECIVFGDGRPQIGALLLPSATGTELSSNRAAFLAAVWPVIEAANANSPSHSLLLPEMVEILPPGTHVPVATKMSILRPACYALFKPLIDSIYERFEAGTEEKRDIDNERDMEAFLLDTVQSVIGKQVDRDTDLFAFGVDSLQAIRIRNTVAKTLALGSATVGQNVVYEYPSIARLADHLLALGSGTTNEKDVYTEMEAMVDKWAAKVVPGSPTQRERGAPEVVLLTGATGSLGAHLVSQLASNPNVVRVICLSRASDHADSLARVQQSLSVRKRTVAMDKVTSFAADVALPNLGLSAADYELCKTATIVLHNAWPVNFNLSLSSFDSQVGGTVNLLNLANANGARFFFSSSVGTCQALSTVPEEFPPHARSAAGTGYARSKWVVEKVLERGGGQVLRIGQLAGDTEFGVWNETEAWPLMFRSATTIGMPELQERPAWLSVDLAARAIAEILLGDSTQRVFHVLNDKEAAWADVLEGLRRGGLEFETVSPAEWLRRLAVSDPDASRNPTYKLLNFYQNRIGNKRAETKFAVTNTAAVSPTVASSRPIDAELVALWTRHWFDSGFFG